MKVKKLHEKYGPVVRLGPNKLDLDYPELIKTLYSADTKWLKVFTSSDCHSFIHILILGDRRPSTTTTAP